jgi:hypothetical protein
MSIDALNWCGVRVRNVEFPGAVFKSVSATWTVPKLAGNPKAGDTWYLASWVGLDGGSNLGGWSEDLLQAGVYQTRENAGDKHCHAFCGWNVTKDSKYPQDPDLPSVEPGNDVSVAITVKFDSVGKATEAAITFKNVTTNEQKSKKLQPIDAVFKGDTIEWIVERAAVDPVALPVKHEQMSDINHDVVEFKNAGGLTLAGDQVTPDKGDLVHMEEDNKPGDYICKAKSGPNWIHIGKIKHS